MNKSISKRYFNLINTSMAAFAVLAAISGCSKEPQAQSTNSSSKGSEIYTFEAVQADSDPSTKTVIQDETAVYWSANDSITVFYGNAKGKFVSTNTSPAAKAEFKGSFSSISGGINIGVDPVDFWGVYPYQSDAEYYTNAVKVTVPAIQTAVEGTFAPDVFPALAKSSNTALAFYNVCGGIIFTVSQAGIQSVTFKGNNNEAIAGSARIGMDSDGKPVVNSYVSASKEIKVNAPYGTSFMPGVKYYLVAFPQTFPNGFEFKYSKACTEATFSSTSSVSISRSTFAKIENKDEELTFGPKSGSIVFADNLAKYACVEKFDTDGDGEVSYAEAYVVPSLNNLFEDYVNITSFEELKYFVNVTDLKGCFYGCPKLKTVTIPENITTIGDNAFRDCSGLETLTIPETVITIGIKAFAGCTLLDEITIAASVKEIGSLAFDSNMKAVTMLGTTPPSIDSDSFVVGTVFYVPKEALEKYKNKRNWTAHADNIYRIIPEGAVDLGLSVLWATCNIGADSPEQYGRYFAWGDVTGQTWNGSAWSGGGFSTYPAYELDASGNLKPAYDAAHVNLGGSWRMPTKAEQEELINNCTSTWTNINGVNGRLFTSKKEGYTDKSIFLPAAGYGIYSYLSLAGSRGYYWSSTFYYDIRAWYLYFYSDLVCTYTSYRYYGRSVRPVSE